MLLGSLAHNVVVWARRWLTQDAASSKLRHYGIMRMVRDVFQVSGFLLFDALGQLVHIVLNQAAPLAPILGDALPGLLAAAHVGMSLGQTWGETAWLPCGRHVGKHLTHSWHPVVLALKTTWWFVSSEGSRLPMAELVPAASCLLVFPSPGG